LKRLAVERAIVATVLVILGTLFTLEGIVYLWADDTIFNSDHFAAMAVEAVREQPVRTEISRLLVDQAVNAKPELFSVRPLLNSVIETLVTTPAFQHILMLGVRELHRSVFDSSQHSYALDLSNGLTIAIGRLQVVDPELANQIPPNVTTGLIEFGKGTLTERISRELNQLQVLMFGLGLAGLTALAAAVIIAPDRRSTLTGLGVTLTVGAVLLVLALSIGHEIVIRRIETESTAQAAGSIFDTFTKPLTAWLWITAVGGVALAAAASAPVHGGGTLGQLARFCALTTEPQSPWMRLLVVAIAAAVGGFMLLAPDIAVPLAARAAGLFVLYLAGSELLRLSGLGTADDREPATVDTRTKSFGHSPAVRFGAIGAVILALFAAGATLWLDRENIIPETASAIQETTACNGHLDLCNRPITQVAFAGTHNSQSAADVPGFYFPEQLRGIRGQLDSGVRALLIKTHYGIQARNGVLTDLSRETEEQHQQLVANLGPDGQSAVQRLIASFGEPPKNATAEPYLCHGFCELGSVYLDDALNDVNDFLNKHPNEVIIIFIGDYVSPSDTAASFTRTGLINRVYAHQPGAPWPTLQQMIDNDRRVLILAEHIGNASKPDWYHDGWTVMQDTPYKFASQDALRSDSSCGTNRGEADAPMFLINNWIPSQTPSPVVAAQVNAYDTLLARVQRCQQLRGLVPNIIAVDFAEKGDLMRVVDTVNGVTP
jgi:hypothetical protein